MVPLKPRLVRYWAAFTRLCQTRSVTQSGPQPIFFRELGAYFDCIGVVDKEERQLTCNLVHTLDSVWLKFAYEEMNKRSRESRHYAGVKK